MILTKFQVLFRLLAARHRMGFKSLSERLAFYLQINPVLNVLTSLWMSSTIVENGYLPETDPTHQTADIGPAFLNLEQMVDSASR